MVQVVRLDISEELVRLDPGAHRTLMLTVTNIGGVLRECRLIVSALPPTWYDLDDTAFALPIDGASTTTLALHPDPSAASPTALYRFRVQVAGPDGLEILDSAVAAMTVGYVGDLRVEAYPVEVEGARGTFEVHVVNELPQIATVLLTADYPPDALRVRLDAAGPLVIPAGGAQRVKMLVVPRGGRAIRAGQRVDITVRGVQQQGDNVTDLHLLQHVHFTYAPRRGILAPPPSLQRLPRRATLLSLALLLALAAIMGGNRLAASGLEATPVHTSAETSTPSPAATPQEGHVASPQLPRPAVTSTDVTTSATSHPKATRTSTPPPVPTPPSISTTPPLTSTITITF